MLALPASHRSLIQSILFDFGNKCTRKTFLSIIIIIFFRLTLIPGVVIHKQKNIKNIGKFPKEKKIRKGIKKSYSVIARQTFFQIN